jgi:hypothetical protein
MRLSLLVLTACAAGVFWWHRTTRRSVCPVCGRRYTVMRIGGRWIYPKLYCVECRREW